MKQPKLRTADKIKPPYQLGSFPSEFIYKVGREIVYKLATQISDSLEGPEWERIFADAIDATWKPSNVGLDDIVKGVCAWGAKSVKNSNPFHVKSIRLISGRNSPAYSFNEKNLGADAQKIGDMVLEIWNARVKSLRNKFAHLRTIVLIKSPELTEFVIYESETVMFPTSDYSWKRNERGNLEGYDKATKEHRFTWQPHGSQFTIVERVPTKKICFKIKKPERVDEEILLKSIGFKRDWITIVKP